MQVKFDESTRLEIIRAIRLQGLSINRVAQKAGVYYLGVWRWLRHNDFLSQEKIEKVIAAVGGRLHIEPRSVAWREPVRNLLKAADDVAETADDNL